MENQTWVVGVDGSDNAAAACDWAVAHAAGRCRELRLVNVWQHPYVGALPMAGTGFTDASAGMAEGAQTLVQAAVERLQVPEGVAVSGAAGEGPAAEVLLDGAADADLLVVGTRGRGGFRRLVLGSVSHQTATHATAPTVVVPLSASVRTASAVMGMDGSANAKAALAWLLDFAPEAALTVVGTWDSGPGHGRPRRRGVLPGHRGGHGARLRGVRRRGPGRPSRPGGHPPVRLRRPRAHDGAGRRGGRSRRRRRPRPQRRHRARPRFVQQLRRPPRPGGDRGRPGARTDADQPASA